MRRTIGGMAVALLVSVVLAWTSPAQATPPDPGGQGDIVGGSPAAPGEFPYQVALLQGHISDPFQAQFCGGSLLTSTRVLTAAHCVDDLVPSQVDVWANSVMLAPGGTRRDVTAIAVHPDWHAPSYRWDLAILDLASPVPGTPISFARPADASRWSAGTMATVTGWGNAVYPGPVWPDHLRKVRVPVVSTASCNADYSGDIHGPSMFCAGFAGGGKDACQGDSGGPLVVPGPGGTRLQIGVVSWGNGCALAGYPGVYARTDTSTAWILSEVPAGCGGHAIGPFPDVLGGHSFCSDIQWLSGSGVTGGYTDGTFRPTSPVTRGSMAAFLYRFAGEPPFMPPGTSPFIDVPTSHVFYKEITWLANTGVTGGYPDGRFRPSSSVTRGSMAAFLYRFDESPPFSPGSPSFSDVPASHLFFKEIEWLADTEVTGGYSDGTFRPGSPVTRGSMAAFLHRFDGL